MVALVVVLDQDLPVGRHLVVAARARDELPGTVVPDHLPQVADVLLERRGVPAGVGEEPPLPLGEPDRYQRVVGLVEPGDVAEARRPL